MNVALILAAGKGVRFDSSFPKQFVQLNDKSILEYSLDIVEELEGVEMTVLVIEPTYEKKFREITSQYKKRIELCPGGFSRQQSVYKGLKKIKENFKITETINVLIHDSARPFARTVFYNVLEKLKTEEAVVPVIKTKDTMYVIEGQKVIDSPCRERLFHVQTPQGFSFNGIFNCHKIADEKYMRDFTDDGSLYLKVEKRQPAIANGDQKNFKITDKKDLLLAEYYLSQNISS